MAIQVQPTRVLWSMRLPSQSMPCVILQKLLFQGRKMQIGAPGGRTWGYEYSLFTLSVSCMIMGHERFLKVRTECWRLSRYCSADMSCSLDCMWRLNVCIFLIRSRVYFIPLSGISLFWKYHFQSREMIQWVKYLTCCIIVFNFFSGKWLELEIVVLIEWSQTQTIIAFSLICGFLT